MDMLHVVRHDVALPAVSALFVPVSSYCVCPLVHAVVVLFYRLKEQPHLVSDTPSRTHRVVDVERCRFIFKRKHVRRVDIPVPKCVSIIGHSKQRVAVQQVQAECDTLKLFRGNSRMVSEKGHKPRK